MDERLKLQNLSRRGFLGRALGAAAFAGISVTVAACGSDDDDGGVDPGGGCENATAGSVASASGHTHSIRDVCQSDAGGSLDLTLTGGGHTHTVRLSSAQVDQVLAGTTVGVDSDGGHVHRVTFN